MALKPAKAASKETVVSNVKPAKAAPKAAPKPAFVRYVTSKDYDNRLMIMGLRPTMPQIPGPCFYKVPQASVADFEAGREFQGGIVVRVDE